MHPLAAIALGFCITFTVVGLARPKSLGQVVCALVIALGLLMLMSRGLA